MSTDAPTSIDLCRAHTVANAAKVMSISRTICYRLIKEGKLRTFTVGRLRRVSDQAIADAIVLLEQEAAAASPKRAA